MSRFISRKAAVAVALTAALIGGGVSAVSPALASQENTSYTAASAGTNWQKIWRKKLRQYTDRRYYSKAKTNKKFTTKTDLRRSLNLAVDNYYTKAQSDAAYATKAQTYTKAEVDAKFAPFVNSVASFAGGEQLLTLTTAEQTVRSVSLMPPANGTVLTSYVASVQTPSAAKTYARCSLTTGPSLDFSHLQVVQLEATDSYLSTSGSRGYPVTKGTLLTVNVVCDVVSGTATLRDSAITAIFAPS